MVDSMESMMKMVMKMVMKTAVECVDLDESLLPIERDERAEVVVDEEWVV